MTEIIKLWPVWLFCVAIFSVGVAWTRLRGNIENTKKDVSRIFDTKGNLAVVLHSDCATKTKSCQQHICDELTEIKQDIKAMDEKRENAIRTREAQYAETLAQFREIKQLLRDKINGVHI